VHLVRRGHFRSREKRWRSHHSIDRSRKPHAARKLHGSLQCIFYRTRLIAAFRTFCSSDLDLDPMAFVYKHDSYPLKKYPKIKNELSTLRLSTVVVLQTDRQTDIQTDRQTHTHTYIQRDRHTDRQTDRHTHTHTYIQTDRQMSPKSIRRNLIAGGNDLTVSYESTAVRCHPTSERDGIRIK